MKFPRAGGWEKKSGTSGLGPSWFCIRCTNTNVHIYVTRVSRREGHVCQSDWFLLLFRFIISPVDVTQREIYPLGNGNYLFLQEDYADQEIWLLLRQRRKPFQTYLILPAVKTTSLCPNMTRKVKLTSRFRHSTFPLMFFFFLTCGFRFQIKPSLKRSIP